MCAACGWLELVADIEGHLLDRETDHTGLILSQASQVIQANEHVTKEQADAVQAIREREGWTA